MADTDTLTGEEYKGKSKFFYDILIGYLIELTNAPSIEDRFNIYERSAIIDGRIYLEAIRDNETLPPLTKPAKVAIDFAIEEVKKLNGAQLKKLEKIGSQIQTEIIGGQVYTKSVPSSKEIEAENQKTVNDKNKVTDQLNTVNSILK